MIRPLRQRHGQVFLLLGVCLPLAWVAGLAARKPPAVVNELPPALAPTPPSAGLVWQRDDLFSNAPVAVCLLRAKDTSRFAVRLSAAAGFVKPDLLVYWTAGTVPPDGALPANTTLLGEFDSPWLLLPPEAGTVSGVLVLYSLADNEIMGVSKRFYFEMHE